MAPRKTATKRRSDSPIPECEVERKKYHTRASNKKEQKNYKEDCIENDSCKSEKAVDDEFTISETRTENVPSRSKQRKNTKHIPKKSSTNCTSSTASTAANLIIPAFKPVNVDSLKVKSELDLSDSDSDDSDNVPPTNKSEPSQQPTKSHSLIHSDVDEEKGNVVPGKFEASGHGSLAIADIWMTNLEALSNGKNSKTSTELQIDNQSCSNHPIKQEVQVNSEKSEKSSGSKQRKRKKTPTNDKRKGTKDMKILDELLECENLKAESDDNDDENWEKVNKETIAEEERVLPDMVEVLVDVGDVKKKRKKFDVQNMIRLKLNRIRREIQQDLHQVSLVGLLAHGFLVNKMLNDPEIAASALSIVPQSGHPPSRTDLNYLEKLVKWVHKYFKLKPKSAETPSYPSKADVLQCISSAEAKSKKEIVYASVAICRSLGILARLVWSLQPISAKVDPSELQLKTPMDNSSKSSKKSEKDKSSSEHSQKAAKEDGKMSACTKKGKNLKVSTKSGVKAEKAEDTSSKRKTGISKSQKSKYFEDEETESNKPAAHKKKGEAKGKKISALPEKKSELAKNDPTSKGRKSKEQAKEERGSRNRRKSAEKPVNYQESSIDDTEEEPSTSSKIPPKRRTSAKEVPQKDSKRKSRSKSRNSQANSSDEFEAIMEDDSEDESSTSRTKSKKNSYAQNRKIISTDSEEDSLRGNCEEQERKKNGCNVWMEVYLEHEEQWMSVDVIGAKVHCDRHLERNASSVLYVVAFNADLTWKDVTARYASSFLSVTRKQRAHRDWSKLLSLNLEKPSAKSKAEDENLERSLTERPLPTSISEFKNHPLYALQRHLLKFEAIYPPTAMPVGYIRGEPVYARECVKCLHSRETWLKEAKVVRVGEKPYKIVKARPKWDRHLQKTVSDLPLDLFGEWQIEDYVPPPAVDGVVPRNAYGNVELFQASMLPKGTKHLQVPGLNKIARRLGIDCAPAMTGWEARGGYSCPVFDGYIVCEEHVETLLDAWQVANAEQEEREREKREKRVYGNWRRLIRGLLIKERLHAKYFSKLTEEEPSPPDEIIDVKPEVSQAEFKAPSKKSSATSLRGRRKK